jgi:ATP/ADP translocase
VPAAKESSDAAVPAQGLSGFPREALASGKVLGFVGLFLLLGPFPSVFIFTFAYLALSRHYHWAKALVVTVIFVVVVYVLFAEILDIQLYHGVLEPLVNNY